ncbi:MAG: hypothetical protein ACRYGF_00905 [Janthinobacterium lividum]
MPCLKTSVLCAMLAVSSLSVHAQTLLQPTNEPTSEPGSSTQYKVIHVAGLDEVKPNVSGDLTLSQAALTFNNKYVATSIPRERIVNVFIGDQRTEPWGVTGKIARKIIPYGGGAALGAITNKKVDLLTVEYRDTHDAYHGVVFVLPARKAAAVRDAILAGLIPPVEQPSSSCTEPLPGSVLVTPIQVSGIDLPDEYRILLYEQTIKELKIKRPEAKFFRVGDHSAGPGCAAFSLDITVTDFQKGNRAVRASTGPLGFFLGTTSLTFDVSLKDVHDKTVFDTQIKKSNRTDSESLGLADTIAKNVAKRFDKATDNATVQMASLR